MSRRVSVIVIALAIVLLIFSTTFLISTSLRRAPQGEVQYSKVDIQKPTPLEIQLVLAKLNQTIGATNKNQVPAELKGIYKLPGSTNDPLGEYLRTLSNFTENMASIKTGLRTAQTLIASGDSEKAKQFMGTLTELRDETRKQLASLYVLLDQVKTGYGVDTGAQLDKLSQLDDMLQKYSEQIDEYNSEIKAEVGKTQTFLTLIVSQTTVFIEEPIYVRGSLRDANGTSLEGRNVTISWGSNMTTLSRTDFLGEFLTNISFPIGSSVGVTEIVAGFTPLGEDSSIYSPSTITAEVDVEYEPSAINAMISSANARPSDFVNVTGNLATKNGTAIASRTVMASLDGAFLQNTTTNAQGVFSFTFAIPLTASNGTHSLELLFPATADRYAPANATLPFTVQVLETTTQLRADRNPVFSGMTLVLSGNVAYSNGTAITGRNVTIYFDGTPYETVPINDDGSFSTRVSIPFSIGLGAHSFRAEYLAGASWIHDSADITNVYVVPTALLILVGAAISGFSILGVYAVRGRRRLARAPQALPQPVQIKAPFEEDLSPQRLISTIEKESSPEAKVRKTFQLAQRVIEQKTHQAHTSSETHLEYFERVAKAHPEISDDLRRLVDLFEVAEYAPYPIGPTESEDAKRILLKLRKEI